MADDTFSIKSLSADDVELPSDAGSLTLAPGQTHDVPTAVLMSDAFADALAEGKVALVKPAKPTSGQAKAGAGVAATLLGRVAPRLVEAERQASAGVDELKRHQEAYERARQHVALLVQAALASRESATSLVRFADAFLSTAAEEAELARLTTALGTIEKKVGRELPDAERSAVLDERETVQAQLDQLRQQQSQHKAELDAYFGTVREQLASSAKAAKTLAADDLAKELTAEEP